MKLEYLVTNREKVGLPEIRVAVEALRIEGYDNQVRVTLEYGDGLRFVKEAHKANADLVIAGSGDGPANEISHGLALLTGQDSPALGVLPLGTANDFATAFKIPSEPYAVLKLAVSGNPAAIDMVKVNDRYIVNVASAGFGAAVIVLSFGR